MIAAALALLAGQAAAPNPAAPPVDWSNLPTLRYLRPIDRGADIAAFVRAEVKAGRCARAVAAAGGWTLSVDVIVLATPAALIRRVVPRAIDCPSVEQYAAGLVSSLARGNIDTADQQTDGWYRTSMTFTWRP